MSSITREPEWSRTTDDITVIEALPSGGPGFVEKRFAVTFFLDYAAKTKREESLSLAALAQRVLSTTAATKEALPWLKFARFGVVPNPRTDSGSLRWDGNLTRITGAVADYDRKEMSPEEAAARLDKAGVAGLVYTSPSHSDAAPKWRICGPFSEELPPEEHYRMIARLNGLLGGVLAGESFTLSQSFYYGSVNRNPAHRVITVDGMTTLDR